MTMRRSCTVMEMPQIYWDHDIVQLGSRDVNGRVTIRSIYLTLEVRTNRKWIRCLIAEC